MNGEQLKEKLNLRNVRIIEFLKVYIFKGQNFEMGIDRELLEQRDMIFGTLNLTIYGHEFSCNVRGDSDNEKLILESDGNDSFPRTSINLNKNIDFNDIPEPSLLESFSEKIYVYADKDGDPVDIVTWYPILKFDTKNDYGCWLLQDIPSENKIKEIHKTIDEYMNVYN